MSIGSRPVVSAVLYKEDGTPFAVTSGGIVGVGTPGHLVGLGLLPGPAGLTKGQVATSSVNITAVRNSLFSFAPSAQQMRVVSSSANDAAAGTGARSIRIWYYDGSLNGPFSTDVTMNGTSGVLTSATDMMFVECAEVLTVGSGGTNASTIWIQDNPVTTTYAQIAVGDGQTYYAHHFVAAGKKCFITGMMVSARGQHAEYFLRCVNPLTANAYEKQVTPRVRVANAQSPYSPVNFGQELCVSGPALVTAYCQADSATATTHFAGFTYVDV